MKITPNSFVIVVKEPNYEDEGYTNHLVFGPYSTFDQASNHCDVLEHKYYNEQHVIVYTDIVPWFPKSLFDKG